MSITGFQDKLHLVEKCCHLQIACAMLVNICLGFYIHERFFFSLQGKADLIENTYTLFLSLSLSVSVSLSSRVHMRLVGFFFLTYVLCKISL